MRQLWLQPWFQVGLAFVAALAVFAWLQPPTQLADPDSWYHARLTTMARDGGLVRDFPWTQSSLYRTIFIDHHLLYHVLLTPFVSLLPYDLSGLKLATVLFAALSVAAVAAALTRWRVPWWGVGTALLLTSAPFLFRLSLAKAPSLAIGVTVVAYYLMVERRLGWLFWWTWFFVWFYSAWPLVVVMALLFVGVNVLEQVRGGWRALTREAFSPRNFKLLGTVAAGVAAGVIINPYFPVNLAYFKQIFGMALVPYHTFIGVGAEWYPFSPFDVPEYLSYPLLVWLLSTLWAAFTFRRQTTLSRTTWLMTVIFFAYTLKARRQTEYLVPWLVISSGLMVRDAGLGQLTLALVKQSLASWVPSWFKRRGVLVALALYAAVVVPWGLAHSPRLARALLGQGYEFGALSGASAWLRQNTPAGAIVFQSDWGTFPMLFYHNPHSYYLTGLDQTFMYEYDSTRYDAWVRATKGETPRIYDIARRQFGASYLLLEKRQPAMLLWLNRDERFTKVYEDAEAILYQLN